MSLLRKTIHQAKRIFRALLAPPPPPPPPPHVISAETAREVLEVIACFTPSDMIGVGKRRIGGKAEDESDGGYILADMLTPDQPILSLGIGPSVTFDYELAEEGHQVVMFDHTVDALPQRHPNFFWHKLGVASERAEDGTLLSLVELTELLPASERGPILKVDVEGAEWEVFATVSPEFLATFEQITVEFHELLSLENDNNRRRALAALRNILVHFVPVHVHGNNCAPLRATAGYPMADVLEVTYVRRDLVQTRPSETWYPMALDRPNKLSEYDFKLWFFPFAPGSAAAHLFGVNDAA